MKINMIKADIGIEPLHPPSCEDCDAVATHRLTLDLRAMGTMGLTVGVFCKEHAKGRRAQLRESLPDGDEHPMPLILALPSKIFDGVSRDTIYSGTEAHRLLKLMEEEPYYYDRERLETCPQYRQPIPYVLVTNAGVIPSMRYRKFVRMRRGKGQGESRLWGKYCIGAGGHVEQGHSIRYTALKELTEELGLPIRSLDFQGLIVSTGEQKPNQVSVDDVHVGVFYHATTEYMEFCSPEHEQQAPVWTDFDNLVTAYPDMEKWSQIVMRSYLGYVDPKATR